MKGHTPHSLEHLHFFNSRRNGFIHYTCNAPSLNVLIEQGIRPIGGQYGCADPREVLAIPLSVYKSKGFIMTTDPNLISLNLEVLLRRLKS